MTGTPPAVPEALPEGTRLLHIGPPKTGTSSLQAAFHGHRSETLAQGTRYAGSSRHSGSAVLAVSGRPSFTRDRGSPAMSKWHNLVGEVRRATEPRVLISSEFFADAEPPAVRRAVEDLGRERLHVVVTLRRLDRIIPSQWQQYVQSNLRLGFDEWLNPTLREPPGPTPTFWRRHRHDQLVARWAAEVGPERLTVVVIDERDHDHILRVFEGLLALRSGTLTADEETVNRSMTWPEIEAVRAFNIAFREAGLGNAMFHKVMHFGAAASMKDRVPPRDEPRIRLPHWARELSAEISREMVEGIRASGVAVVGDLEALVPSAASIAAVGEEGPEARGCVTPEIAAGMAVGMAIITGHARGSTEAAERSELSRYATYQLTGAVFGRARRQVGRALAALTALPRRPVGARSADPAALDGATAATAEAIRAQLEEEGLRSPRSRDLVRRGLALAAEAVPRALDGEAREERAGCVAPTAAAWYALSMLEAAGVVRSVGPRPGPLRPTLWPWVEPPRLARIPTSHLVRALPKRYLAGLARRLRR